MRIFSFYLLFISLLFQGCFETNNNSFDGKNISINSEIKVDSSIINFYLPYKSKLQDGLMNKPISYSLKTYKKNDGILNSSLGNMFADVLVFNFGAQSQVPGSARTHASVCALP